MPTFHITQDEPIYSSQTDTVHFSAVIDGTPATCEISTEALSTHFGASRWDAASRIQAFKENRAAIEAVGRVKLPARLMAGRGILLEEDF